MHSASRAQDPSMRTQVTGTAHGMHTCMHATCMASTGGCTGATFSIHLAGPDDVRTAAVDVMLVRGGWQLATCPQSHVPVPASLMARLAPSARSRMLACVRPHAWTKARHMNVSHVQYMRNTSVHGSLGGWMDDTREHAEERTHAHNAHMNTGKNEEKGKVRHRLPASLACQQAAAHQWKKVAKRSYNANATRGRKRLGNSIASTAERYCSRESEKKKTMQPRHSTLSRRPPPASKFT